MKISVVVHPNARNPRIEGSPEDTLHVYVRAPAREGKANKAVAEALAEYFHTAKGCIALLSGATARTKIFEIIET